MSEVPRDLIRMGDVLKEYKPSRSWWDARIAAGDIQAYTIPGERSLYLSKADVERILQPRPYERTERSAREA